MQKRVITDCIIIGHLVLWRFFFFLKKVDKIDNRFALVNNVNQYDDKSEHYLIFAQVTKKGDYYDVESFCIIFYFYHQKREYFFASHMI